MLGHLLHWRGHPLHPQPPLPQSRHRTCMSLCQWHTIRYFNPKATYPWQPTLFESTWAKVSKSGSVNSWNLGWVVILVQALSQCQWTPIMKHSDTKTYAIGVNSPSSPSRYRVLSASKTCILKRVPRGSRSKSTVFKPQSWFGFAVVYDSGGQLTIRTCPWI